MQRTAAGRRLFRTLAASHLPGSPHLYGSFDVHGVHCILLNAQEHLHTDPRWGNVFLAQLSAAQQAWLRADLERHRDARAIAVFLHQPLWSHWSSWQPVHELLRAYRVDAVVAAHVHTDRDDGVLDGIRYLVLGAAGGTVQHARPDAAGTAQVAVLSLGDGPTGLELLDAVTGRRLPLTPRADAERLQALGYLIDNLEVSLQGDGSDSRPGWPMGTGQGRAMLRLDGLGNPIDLPVAVEIDVRGEGVSLTGSGVCAGPVPRPGGRGALRAGRGRERAAEQPLPGQGADLGRNTGLVGAAGNGRHGRGGNSPASRAGRQPGVQRQAGEPARATAAAVFAGW